MAKSTKTTASSEGQPTVSVETLVKALIVKKAKDIFEREPHQAFVPKNLDNLVAEIVNLFN